MNLTRQYFSRSLVNALLACSLQLVLTEAAVEVCDLIKNGTSFDVKDPSLDNCTFIALDSSFFNIVDEGDDSIGVRLLAEADEDIFHEGPVLFENDMYFATNRLGVTDDPGFVPLETAPAQFDQYINIMKIDLTTLETSVTATNDDILMANGMTNSADGESILVLSQGFNRTGSAIYDFNPRSLEFTPVLSTIFGAQFNSLNDIKVTEDGVMFFSDPVYGFEQGFRQGSPELGSNVYRYDSKTKRVSVMVTRLQRPNGVALYDGRDKGEGCVLYMSDTGFDPGMRGFHGWSDDKLYSMEDKNGCFEPENGPFTLQAHLPTAQKIADGMFIHKPSKLLFYCDGAGMWVWSLAKKLHIGCVALSDGCTQVIAEQEDGIVSAYILAETKLWTTTLNLSSADGEDNPPISEVRRKSSSLRSGD